MADMNIGTAYVRIEPTAKGISGKIEKELGGIGKTGGESFGKGFGSVLGGVGKAAAGAVAAASAAAIGVVKSATESYAEFEQLEGGAKLLFGDAFDTVIKNANNAFSEVQMSANDYLETANSYATGLKEALGGDGQAAAELTNKIITAQADIVAATGNSAENVANAFAGIMKNNFTMLDNLQLGIKPTKEGMQEVIDKMNELNGTKYEMGNLADMQSAIVDYVKYVGMAGYAHEEGAKTIQGSLASTKAAWQNLLTGLTTGEDITPLIDNLVNSFSSFADNILPVVERALVGVGDLVAKLAPVIADRLPGLIEQLLPSLISAATSLVLGLVQALPTIITALVSALPTVLVQLVQALVDALPVLIDGAIQLVVGIVEHLPEIIMALINAMPTIITSLVSALIDAAPQLLIAALQLILTLSNGIIQAIPQAVQALMKLFTQLVTTIKSKFPEWLAQGKNLVTQFAQGIQAMKENAKNAMVQVFNSIKSGISGLLSNAASWGRDMIANFVNGILSKIGEVRDAASNIASTVRSYIHFSEPDVGPLSDFSTYAPDMVNLFAKGLEDSESVLQKQMAETFTPPTLTEDTANSASYAPYNTGVDASGIYQLLAQYLPLLGQETNVNVSLEGDADGLFRTIRNEASRFAKSTGYSPFPA